MLSVFLNQKFFLLSVVILVGFFSSVVCSSGGGDWPNAEVNKILGNMVRCDTQKKLCSFQGEILVNRYDFRKEGSKEGSFVLHKLCEDVDGSRPSCPEPSSFVAYYNARHINLASQAYGLSFDSVLAHEIFHVLSVIKFDGQKVFSALDYSRYKDFGMVRMEEPSALNRYSVSTYLCDYINTRHQDSLRKARFFYNSYIDGLGDKYESLSFVDSLESPAQYVAFKHYVASSTGKGENSFVNEYCENRKAYVYANSFRAYAYLEGILVGFILDSMGSPNWKRRVIKGEMMMDILLEKIKPIEVSVNSSDKEDVGEIDDKSHAFNLKSMGEYFENISPCEHVYEVEKNELGEIVNINVACE